MKIDPNKKIEVYFNLHKKIWSVRQSGKVVGHTNYIEVKDPQYVVRQGGNERVRREKKKNVHAFVRGYAMAGLPAMPAKLQFVSYNPYKNNSFVIRNTNDTICSSPFAALEVINETPRVEALWY
jgi:hypothetical protein